MQEKRLDKWDLLIIGIILTIGIIIWSAPISNLPFGDVDASTHFALSYDMSQTDKPIYDLPYHIKFDYGFANNNKIWYPPQFHMLGALFQLFTSSKIVMEYIFYLLCGLAIIPTLYLLIRYLFGRWPAILSSVLLIISRRDYMTYLWGLWPERLSFAFTPLVLYLFYKYTEKKELKYMIFTAILGASQFLLHPQGGIQSVLFILLFSLFIWIKDRKFPMKINHIMVGFIIASIMILPFISGTIGFGKNVMQNDYGSSLRIHELGTLLKWYPEIPYTPSFGDFGFIYYTWLILPFILLGLVWCIIKRNKEHLMMLSLAIGLYILMHLNVIGIIGRAHRSLNMEAHIFYPLAILGLLWIIPDFKKLRYIIPALLVGTYLIIALQTAIPDLSSAYQGLGRVNEYQVDACNWIMNNTAEDIDMLDIGTLNYANRKWIRTLCLRHLIYDDKTLAGTNSTEYGMQDHIYLDMSEAIQLKDNSVYNALKEVSATLKNKTTLIYSNPLVEVYKLG